MHPAVIRPHVFGANIGMVIQAVAHHLFGDLRHDLIHRRIIGTQYSHPVERQPLEEINKGLLQLAEVMAVGLHVIGIDIRDDRNHGR